MRAPWVTGEDTQTQTDHHTTKNTQTNTQTPEAGKQAATGHKDAIGEHFCFLRWLNTPKGCSHSSRQRPFHHLNDTFARLVIHGRCVVSNCGPYRDKSPRRSGATLVLPQPKTCKGRNLGGCNSDNAPCPFVSKAPRTPRISFGTPTSSSLLCTAPQTDAEPMAGELDDELSVDVRLRRGVSGNESVCSTTSLLSSWAAGAGDSSSGSGWSKSPTVSSNIKASGAAAVGGASDSAPCSVASVAKLQKCRL